MEEEEALMLFGIIASSFSLLLSAFDVRLFSMLFGSKL